MSVKVVDNTPFVKSDADRKASLALRLIVDAIDSQSIPKTPMRHGDLRRNKFKRVLGLHGQITWLQDYALFQEVKQYANYTTGGTGPHFAENAVKSVVDRSGSIFKQVGL